MRRRIALTVALAISLFSVGVMSSDSSVKGQQSPQQRFRADTGFVTLGENQVLRFSTALDINILGIYTGSVWQINYIPGNCQGGVCKHASANPNPVGSVQLMPGEAASIDLSPIPGASGVRAVMVGNRRNVIATAAIINTLTGETVSHIIVANTDGDIH